MIDHTIQTGNGKCFLVLGVRMSQWQTGRQLFLEAPQKTNSEGSFSLTHQDLSVWAIERVDSSKGQTVCGQLKELSKETGVVPALVVDRSRVRPQEGL